MICPVCKKETQESSKFCTSCGVKLPRCPVCNRVVTTQSRFCVHDGTPLPEDVVSVFSKGEKEPAAEMPSAKKHYCVNCGAECPDTQLICLKCQEQTLSAASGKRPAKKKKSLIPLLCVLLMIGIIGISGFFLFGDSQGFELPWQSGISSSQETDDEDSEETDDEEETREDSEEETEEEPDEEPEEDASVGMTEEPEVPAEPPLTEEPEGADGGVTTEDSVSVEQVDPVVYFILNCDKEYFSGEYFAQFDAEMCRIARNGIYARMGRKFKDEGLTKYFMTFDWYVPTIAPENFSETMLNEYQIANRDLIVAIESERGYR